MRPGRLLIYYGWPSCINGSRTTSRAARHFSRYHYVVLGDGLTFPGHGDHAKTKEIISRLPGILFFGYIDLGVSTQNLTLVEIGLRLREWKRMGATGVLLDDFGFDYGVNRNRQNMAVGMAHENGLSVIANAWNPPDVFEGSKKIDARDFYLFESFVVREGRLVPEDEWRDKSDQLAAYRAKQNFGILSVTTNSGQDFYSKELFKKSWSAAREYDHAATGWGEYLFSADDSSAPFRSRFLFGGNS